MSRSFDWTAALDKALTDNWATAKTLTELAAAAGCEKGTIKRRARTLNLPARHWRSTRYDTILRPLEAMEFPKLRECQWPFGDPLEPGFSFCGAKVFAHMPYCPMHLVRSRKSVVREEDAE